jgi:DNA-binding NarL/FixJ family response regulator/signal transduction histidine kinase
MAQAGVTPAGGRPPATPPPTVGGMVNVILALGTFIGVLTGIVAANGAETTYSAAFPLAAWLALLLTFRNRWPTPVLVLSVLGVMAMHAGGLIDEGWVWPATVAYFTVAGSDRRWAGPGWAAGIGVFELFFAFAWETSVDAGEMDHGVADPLPVTLGLDVLWLAVVVAAGAAYLNQRRWRAQVADNLARLEHEQELQARRRTAEERLQIARELHDVVAHTLTVVGVQLRVAVDALDDAPDEARDALRKAQRVRAKAVADLRSLMDALRDPHGPESAARPPGEDTTDGIEGLVERTRAAGLDITVETSGDTSAVPAHVALAVHRVVQESLTNTVRHAGARHATVVLRVGADRVDVRVRDDGTGPAPDAAPGHGIAGMRERVTALGGALTTGPGPDGTARGARPHSHDRLPVVTVRVLLADDQALVRAGFRSLLRRDREIEVVGEAGTGDEAVRAARELRPDVVLMDIRMPGLDGIAATARIVGDADLVGCRVVILTTFETDEHVFGALRAGASGFLTKEIEPEDLRRAVRAVAAGDALLSPSVTRRVIEQFAHRPVATTGPDPRLALLTARESEVVRLIATGLSNVEIARRLVISPLTAKTHVTRAITKLGLRDRVQLVIFAYESGMIRPG